MPNSRSSPTLRRAALAIAAVAALAVGFPALEKIFAGGLPAPMDFAAFWTAGQIGCAGGNVYDAAAVQQVQRGIGLNDTAIMMWNPPWTLTLVLPLGWLSFPAAYGLWVLVNIGLMLASAELLCRAIGGARAVAYLLTITFAPALLLIFSGQLTMFVLVGLAGYIVLRPRHPYLAGAVGAVTAIKPHMLVLFALWLLVDAIRTRDGRKVLLGGATSLLALSIPATLANPDIWNQYVAITTSGSSANHEHVASWSPPLVGWWLRMHVPGQPFWVQWLPLAAGVALFVIAFRKRREADVPTLVGLSMFIAPYGVWHHDLVLMLLPIVATAAKLSERTNRAAIAFGLAGFLLADAAMIAMILTKAPYQWFVWVVPATLLGCLGVERLASREPASAPRPLGA